MIESRIMNFHENIPSISGGADERGTQAIARAAAILREVASANRSGCRAVDLAHRLGLERSTAHRILQRLVSEEFLQQDPKSRLYRLGRVIHELGIAAAPPISIRDLCEPAMTRIATETGDTSFLIAASGLDGICLDRREGPYQVKALILEIGQRRPLGIGAGSITILSCLEHGEALAILERNAKRLELAGESNFDSLSKLVAKARDKGYALKTPSAMPAIQSLGVPLRRPDGRAFCAISVSALSHRINGRLEDLVGILQREATVISQQWSSHW